MKININDNELELIIKSQVNEIIRKRIKEM